jgi:AP2 domain/HNH endonuclease
MKPIRPIRIERDFAYVLLTKGYKAIIDAADVHLVEGFNWCAFVGKRTVYAVRSSPRDADGKQRAIHMHRVLMDAPPHLEVDHKDGDGLDNRRSSNLRLATSAQNRHNQRISSDNTSGVKGVHWNKNSNKWRVQIMLNGKRKHLGYFNERELAATAYARASAELHGEFGRTT